MAIGKQESEVLVDWRVFPKWIVVRWHPKRIRRLSTLFVRTMHHVVLRSRQDRKLVQWAASYCTAASGIVVDEMWCSEKGLNEKINRGAAATRVGLCQGGNVDGLGGCKEVTALCESVSRKIAARNGR